MKKVFLTLALLAGLTLTACTKIVPIHREDVQQGNLISQQQVNQLKMGMSKSQVSQILGEPVLQSTFDPNRWNYAYSLQPGDGPYQEKHAILYFKNDRLYKVEGSLKPQ